MVLSGERGLRRSWSCQVKGFEEVMVLSGERGLRRSGSIGNTSEEDVISSPLLSVSGIILSSLSVSGIISTKLVSGLDYPTPFRCPFLTGYLVNNLALHQDCY